ncbi:hypothetical protein LR002_02485 [Candidatus Gracilibacteria bacterium]|nr:hypothetical protein [Candidatus Gracilibacteria bacterium]
MLNFQKIFFGIILFFGIFCFFPNFTNAGYLPDGWANEIDNQLKLTHKDGDGVEQVKTYLTGTFVPLIKFIMVGISIIFIIVSLFAVIFSVGAEAENAFKKFGTNFGFAILGFVLISFSGKIAEAVDPILGNNNADFGNIGAFESMANILVDFSAILIGGIAVAVIVISGIKIVKSQGEGIEDEFKKILSAGVGLMVTLLSRKFIYEIFFTNYGMKGVNEGASLSTTQEIMGVVGYFMQFITIGGVGLIILAGVYYIFSSGEGNDNTELAKGIMKNVAIGLVILMSSYSLVTIFLPN